MPTTPTHRMSPNQTPPPEPEHTAASILGELVRVSRRHPALDPDDECSECGARLSAATDGTIYLADCGRYCSPECAESHATFLAGAWNRGNCPRCRKAYQARNVNAADHRVDYRDADGSTAHLCGQCWRDPQPPGAAAAPADGLTRQPGADPK